MTTVLFGMNLFLTLIEVLALYLFATCFFPLPRTKKYVFFSLAVLAASSILAYLLAQGVFFAKLVLIVVVDAIWIHTVFRTNVVKSIITALFFYSLMVLGDGVLMLGITFITRQDTQSYMDNPYFYYTICYVIKMMELAGIVILRMCIPRQDRVEAATWHDWLRTLMFPVASILLSMLLVQIYAISKATAALVLTASVILVLTDILAIFLLNYLEEQQQKLHDSSILRHDLKMERDNITAWMNAYTNQRKQTHEYQHQLSLLRGYAAQEAPNGELIRYLDRLLQTDLSQSLFVKTERTVVDVILNQKYALAQSNGITFQMQLDHLAEFALDDDGLVIVLSNLIDNAIEACMQVPDPADRKILLKMRVTPDESFLYIENTTATAVEIVNNQVVTTKTDALEHGYGLKNIDAVLQRVDAAYTLDYQEDTHTFCFSVQIIPDK